MNEQYFSALVQELIDENPFACRAVMKILHTELTDTLPTLAVTIEERPRLLVNPAFIEKHCQTEAHIKAVICHEFLHVLLRHTEPGRLQHEADHFALDAVINAIIHRELGEAYSGFMSRYYGNATGLYCLLKPPPINRYGYTACPEELANQWHALYDGQLCADDVREIAEDIARAGADKQGTPNWYNRSVERWLGNHYYSDESEPADLSIASPVLHEALEKSLRAMNGSGIWREPRHGVVAHAYDNRVTAADEEVSRWCRDAFAVLRKHLQPDRTRVANTVQAQDYQLPVMNPGDRRSFGRALWSPLLPNALWQTEQKTAAGTAQIYLDVSGSMDAEMPLLVSLLARLGKHIRKPLWAFSNVVVPAVIEDGQLKASTTGGTSITCVLEHVRETRPSSAVIVTDGYIETVSPELVRQCEFTQLHAIVTRDGATHALNKASIASTQLGRLPQ